MTPAQAVAKYGHAHVVRGLAAVFRSKGFYVSVDMSIEAAGYTLNGALTSPREMPEETLRAIHTRFWYYSVR